MNDTTFCIWTSLLVWCSEWEMGHVTGLGDAAKFYHQLINKSILNWQQTQPFTEAVTLHITANIKQIKNIHKTYLINCETVWSFCCDRRFMTVLRPWHLIVSLSDCWAQTEIITLQLSFGLWKPLGMFASIKNNSLKLDLWK